MTNTPDFTRQQMNRGALIGAILDITYGQWTRRLQVMSEDDIPVELSDPLVDMVESLQQQGQSEQIDPNARGTYLQALCILSDDALTWIVQEFGLVPDNLI